MRKKQGFTVMELLVVIAVIAVLAATVIPTMANVTEKAARATDMANARSIESLLAIAVADGQITFPANGASTGVWVLVCKDNRSTPKDYNGINGTVFCGTDAGVAVNDVTSDRWNLDNPALRRMMFEALGENTLRSYSGGSSRTVNGVGGWDWYIVQYSMDPATGEGSTRIYSGFAGHLSSQYKVQKTNFEQYRDTAGRS